MDAAANYRRLMTLADNLPLKDFLKQEAPEWTLFPAANDKMMSEGSRLLGRPIPEGLVRIYAQSNGLCDSTKAAIIWPAMELAGRNEKMRSTRDFRSIYMPFDHLLFFGENGGGDQYAFPIHADGTISKLAVFIWNHEDDSRSYVANTPFDLVIRTIAEV